MQTNKEPHRKVYINSKFAGIVRKIYNNYDFDREVIEISEYNYLQANEEVTHYSTSVKPDLNIAYIKLEKIGRDAIDVIAYQLKQFKLKKIETIYLEYPVSEEYSAYITEKANEMGFLFSGIVPEFCDGDVLKMQYLNNVLIDADKINLAGELAKEILQYIMQDYK